MAHIVTKQNRFYVVTYDGINPTTGKEQRGWHLAGSPETTLKRSPRPRSSESRGTRRSTRQ